MDFFDSIEEYEKKMERNVKEKLELMLKKEKQLQSVMIKKLVIKIQRKMQHKRHYLGF